MPEGVGVGWSEHAWWRRGGAWAVSAAEKEAAGSVRCEGRDREACSGLGAGGPVMRVCRGAGPPGPVAGAAATLVLLLSGVAPAHGSEDIVVGCGGFVKSDVEINYSLIEVSARPAARA